MADAYKTNEYGLYRFVRKRANGKDAFRTADNDTLVIVAIGMMMSEFQPGHVRIPDIERMIEWAKHNTAVHNPTHIVIVAVTSYDINEEWNKDLIGTVSLAGLPTTVVQLMGKRRNEDLLPKSIMRDAADLLKSDGSARDIVAKLHLGAHPMQADLVTSDSSSPAPYIPVAEPGGAVHQDFAPEGSLFVNHEDLGGERGSGGRYKVTNLWSFGKRWINLGNTIEFTPQDELATREGQEKMPLYRSGYGPAEAETKYVSRLQPLSFRERSRQGTPVAEKPPTTTRPSPQAAGGGTRDGPWTEFGMTQDEYNEHLTLTMLANEGLLDTSGMATTAVV